MRFREIRESFRSDTTVPAILYHGTSLGNYRAMLASDRFTMDAEGHGNYGFSTTEDVDMAMKFARMKTGEDERWGVVISLNGDLLSRLYDVHPYDDDEEYETHEAEWVIFSDQPIRQIRRFIREAKLLDTRRRPDNDGWTENPAHLLPWREV